MVAFLFERTAEIVKQLVSPCWNPSEVCNGAKTVGDGPIAHFDNSYYGQDYVRPFPFAKYLSLGRRLRIAG